MDIDLDKVKPVRFPTAWLTYKARITRDLNRAYAADGGAEYFNADYVNRLSAQAKQLEDWLVKLYGLQIALTGFLVIGFLGNDASLSLFGVTLKQAIGVKEIIISLSALIAMATWMVLISRDTALSVLERLVELSTAEPFVPFGKLAGPTSFNVKVYVPRAYEDWIFPTRANKMLFNLLLAVSATLLFAVFLFSFAVNLVLILDIYRQPTLGTWSIWILSYVGLTFFVGLLFLARFYLPQPYLDQSISLALKELEAVDPKLYRRQCEEVYGEHSKYRKYKLSFHVALGLTRLRSAIFSTCAAVLAKIRFRRRGPWS
jgi:Zn-dependent protease with chaperone function